MAAPGRDVLLAYLVAGDVFSEAVWRSGRRFPRTPGTTTCIGTCLRPLAGSATTSSTSWSRLGRGSACPELFSPRRQRQRHHRGAARLGQDDKILIEAFIRKRAKAKAKAEDTKAKKIIAKAKAEPKAKKIIAKAKAKTEGTKAKKIIAK